MNIAECPECQINDLSKPFDMEYWKEGDPLVCFGCQEEPMDCRCCRRCGEPR